MLVTAWKETCADLLPEGFFTESHARGRREMWAQLLTQQRVEWSIHLAESDGEIIGFAMAGPAHEESDPAADGTAAGAPALAALVARALHASYVLRAHHGSGAGQALLDATIDSGPGPGSGPGLGSWSMSMSMSMLMSESGPVSEPWVSRWVARQNRRAMAFCRRNGFRRDGAEKRHPGAPAMTDVRMVRP